MEFKYLLDGYVTDVFGKKILFDVLDPTNVPKTVPYLIIARHSLADDKIESKSEDLDTLSYRDYLEIKSNGGFITIEEFEQDYIKYIVPQLDEKSGIASTTKSNNEENKDVEGELDSTQNVSWFDGKLKPMVSTVKQLDNYVEITVGRDTYKKPIVQSAIFNRLDNIAIVEFIKTVNKRGFIQPTNIISKDEIKASVQNEVTEKCVDYIHCNATIEGILNAKTSFAGEKECYTDEEDTAVVVRYPKDPIVSTENLYYGTHDLATNILNTYTRLSKYYVGPSLYKGLTYLLHYIDPLNIKLQEILFLTEAVKLKYTETSHSAYFRYSRGIAKTLNELIYNNGVAVSAADYSFKMHVIRCYNKMIHRHNRVAGSVNTLQLLKGKDQDLFNYYYADTVRLSDENSIFNNIFYHSSRYYFKGMLNICKKLGYKPTKIQMVETEDSYKTFKVDPEEYKKMQIIVAKYLLSGAKTDKIIKYIATLQKFFQRSRYLSPQSVALDMGVTAKVNHRLKNPYYNKRTLPDIFKVAITAIENSSK